MLWLLAELFEELPEVGDLEKPKLVFFFDEAHLLFHDSTKALRDNIEQVVKLIRSKGVGVYFITQQPSDVPDPILAQLGNRVQHALRAYTPSEQRAVRAAAQTFRVNPEFDTEEAIMALGTGEAIVSFLDEKGRPNICERVTIMPPQSMMGAIDDERREAEIHADDLYGKYDVAVDNESAYEMINAKKIEQNRIEEEQRAKEEEAKRLEQEEKERIKAEKEREKELAREEKEREKERKEREKAQKEKEKKKAARKKNSALGKAANTAANTVGREIGKSIVRGILGIFKKK
jgi:DNA helicase HerA-like ATPase